MEREASGTVRVELKYCERCGKLWLREQSTGKVHCALCTSEMVNFLLCSRTFGRPALPGNGQLQLESWGEPAPHSGKWGRA